MQRKICCRSLQLVDGDSASQERNAWRTTQWTLRASFTGDSLANLLLSAGTKKKKSRGFRVLTPPDLLVWPAS